MNTLALTRLAAVSLLALGSTFAQAAFLNYSYTGALDSGSAAGETYSGTFGVDDAGVLGSGDAYLAVSDFSLAFMGLTYDANDGVPEAHFFDGVFVGVDFSAAVGSGGLALISGFSEPAEAFFAFDPIAPGVAGFGSLSYTLHPPVQIPEPGALALLLAGVGACVAARRRG